MSANSKLRISPWWSSDRESGFDDNLATNVVILGASGLLALDY